MRPTTKKLLLLGGRGFTPLSFAPAFFLLPKPPYLFTDAAHTTPLTADGQTVGAATNQGSDGGFWTQSTSGSRPTYHTSADKHWIDLDGSDDFLAYALSTVQTICMAVRVSASSEDLDTWIGNDNDDAELRIVNTVDAWRTAQAADFSVGGSFFVNGIATSSFTADVDQVVRAVATAGRSTGVLGRASAALGRYAMGRIYGAVGFAGTLSASQAAQVDLYLSTLTLDDPV